MNAEIIAPAESGAKCYECGGSHEPIVSRYDCIRHWKIRAVMAENQINVAKHFGHIAAVSLGRLGGKAGTGKAKARTSKQARKAALARWAERKDSSA